MQDRIAIGLERFHVLERRAVSVPLVSARIGAPWTEAAALLRPPSNISRTAPHWPAVKALSSEPMAAGTVLKGRAQELLDRWMPSQTSPTKRVA